jgi:hypothetical protein
MDTIANVQSSKSSKINEANPMCYHPHVIIYNNPQFAEYSYVFEKKKFKTILKNNFIKMFAKKQSMIED